MTTSRQSAPSSRGTVTAPQYVPWLVVALILAPALVTTAADPDLWGHVRFGLDMLQQHTLPSIDPYSFTQDVPWVNHEWLSELIMGAAYRVGGSVGLSLLKGMLVAALLAFVLRAYAHAAPAAIGGAIVLLAAGTGRQIVTLRPQLWTLLGVAVMCRMLTADPRRWWLIGAPFLFVLWVNLHGGWIVGAGLLAVWTAFQMTRRDAPRGLIAAVAALSAVATLINPYGWRMWTFLAGTVRMSRDIAEWRSLATVPILARLPWVVAVAGLLVLATRKPRPSIDRMAMIGLLAYGAFRVERLSPLLVVATVVLMAPTVTTRWNPGVRSFDRLTVAAARGVLVGVVLLATASAAAVANTSRCISIAGDWIPDRVAGVALAATRTQGRIVTYFDWGEYAIWHLAPRLRVSIDGRRETIYSDAARARQAALEAATPEGLAYLQRVDPDYVWLPASFTTLRDWLSMHGYRVDLQTDRSFVAVRADQPVLPVPTAPASGCFPGP
jgi:hypothetical protein